MKSHFEQCAAYNKWANAKLYEAAIALTDDEYRRDVGVFFKSMLGTLNHLLLTDRLWLKRLTGEGDHPTTLDTILYENRNKLIIARANEDERLVRYVDTLDEASIDGILAYETTSGKPHEQRPSEILAHLFNHQTHHRGQAHTILSICTGQPPPALDLLLMQRGGKAPDLRSLVSKALA